MQVPAFIGKYELLELLGSGTAEIFRARDTTTGNIVSVKLLAEGADRRAKARFLEESTGVVDSGEYEGRPYIVTAAVRVPVSAKGSLIHLSAAVYGAVLFFTALSIATWLYVKRSLPAFNTTVPHVGDSVGPKIVHGMIFIEGGTFLAGPDKHPATVKPFYIDTTEVTAGDYCDVMRCPSPPRAANLPIVNITVAEAREYASKQGKRLPTPLEWERAARGAKGNAFPWGDQVDPRLANVADNPALGGHDLVQAKSFRPYPEYQMIGNAWEMVEGAVKPSPEAVASFATLLKPPPTADEHWIAVRGGSFKRALAPNVVWGSMPIPERYAAPDIGFRCARDP